MKSILWLLPIALILGACGLAAFFWSMRAGQFDDLEGDASRIFEDDDRPL